MDRIDFSKSISIDPTLQIKVFFNEIMTMYNLVEGVDYTNIHGLVENETNISFAVTFDNIEKAIRTSHSIDGKIVQFYNCNFMISTMINKNNAELVVQLVRVMI